MDEEQPTEEVDPYRRRADARQPYGECAVFRLGGSLRSTGIKVDQSAKLVRFFCVGLNLMRTNQMWTYGFVAPPERRLD